MKYHTRAEIREKLEGILQAEAEIEAITFEEAIAELRRELALRLSLYTRFVEAGRKTFAGVRPELLRMKRAHDLLVRMKEKADRDEREAARRARVAKAKAAQEANRQAATKGAKGAKARRAEVEAEAEA